MLRLLILAALAALLPAAPAGASTAADICPPGQNPCVVQTKLTVTNGSILDFGSRTLEVRTGGQIAVDPVDATTGGSMTIRAGSVILRPNGVLKAQRGSIEVVTAGDILIEAAGTSRGRVDVSGEDGGELSLCTPSCLSGVGGGTITIHGDVQAQATSGFGYGGLIDLTAAAILVGPTGVVRSTGGGEGGGGSIELFTAGDITVNGPVTTAGGSGDGGDVTLDAGGSVVTTAELNANGRVGNWGSGFSVDVYAVNDVAIGGLVDGRGAGNLVNGGGDGAEVFILAETGDVTVSGQLLAEGASPDGLGGGIDVVAELGSIVQTGLVSARCAATEGAAGDVSFTAAGSIVLGSVDATAGLAGGSVSALTLGGTVTVAGPIDASGTNASAAVGGLVDVQGCGVTVLAGIPISALGDTGENLVRASGLFTLQGALNAGRDNVILYRDPTMPPVISGSITPAATPILSPALPPCDGASTTTSTSSTTSTTSTTGPPATSTSTTSTSSTTVTTGAPTSSTSSTTTSTSPPTSTTAGPSTSSSTSTSATVPPSTTTSTTLPLPTCDPAAPATCDDGDLCTTDACDVLAGCRHEPAAGYAAVTCRLDTLAATLVTVPADQVGGAKTQRKLAAKIGRTRSRVDAARIAPANRSLGKLKRAKRLLGGFLRAVQRGLQSGRITAEVGSRLLTLASGATAGLEPLVAGAQAARGGR